MVKESVKNVIREKLDALCSQYGITERLEMKDKWDDEVDVFIPASVGNSKRDELDAICNELEKIEFVKEIYQSGRDIILRGLDKREFNINVKEGFWEHTTADDEAERQEMRSYFDNDYAKQKRKEEEEERRKYWMSYILPLPKCRDTGVTEVYLPLSYQAYDWIKNGEKTTEFRRYDDKYARKLFSHPVKKVRFQRAYGGRGRPKPEQMVWEVKSITLYDAQSNKECPPDKLVEGIIPTFFAINLGKRIC